MLERGIFPYLEREELQIILLFLLGSCILILYHIVDLRLKKYWEGHQDYMWKISDTSKDLVTSYSYIGVLNRKIEILKEIIDLFSKKSGNLPEQKSDYLCQSLLNAIVIFAGCSDVIVGFYEPKRSKVLFEMGTRDGFHPKINRDLCFYENKDRSTKDTSYTIIRLGEEIDGVSAYCILKRFRINIQDADIIKTLLLRATSLYVSEGCPKKKFKKR